MSMTAQLQPHALAGVTCPGQLELALTPGHAECWTCGTHPANGRLLSSADQCGEFCSADCADEHSRTYLPPPSDQPGAPTPAHRD